MKEFATLTVSLASELMTTVRLATGGVCALEGLGLDDSEDCKVCVTESLLLLMHRGYPRARILFAEEDGLLVRVTGEGSAAGTSEDAGDEISFALIAALNEGATIERENGRLQEIVLRFLRRE